MIKKSYWSQGDNEALIANLFDVLSKVVVTFGICISILKMSLQDTNTVFWGNALSWIVIGIIITFFAHQHSKKQMITTPPLGMGTSRTFFFLMGVLVPLSLEIGVYKAYVAVVALNFIAAWTTFFFTLMGHWISRWFPTISFTVLSFSIMLIWMILTPFSTLLEIPITGLVAGMLILFFYFGKWKLPIPVFLLIAIVGTAVYYLTGNTHANYTIPERNIFQNINPFSLFIEGMPYIKKYLSLTIALSFAESMNSITAVKMAEKEGSPFSLHFMAIVVFIGNMISAVCGSFLCWTIFFGYKAWKDLGAGPYYMLGLCSLVPLIMLTPILYFIGRYIPIGVFTVALIYIGLCTIESNFEHTPAKYHILLIIGVLPALIGWLYNNLMHAFSILSTEKDYHTLFTDGGIGIVGYEVFGQGSLWIGFLYTAVFFCFAKKIYWQTAIYVLLCSLLSSIGFIHGSTVHIPIINDYSIFYGVLAIILFVAHIIKKGVKHEKCMD